MNYKGVSLFLAAYFGFVAFCMAQVVSAQPDTVLLHRPFDAQDYELFARPTKSFYPETWFHFLNGSVDRKGITKDLEAIAETGIVGVQFFHGQQGNPADWPGTEEHIECLSPKWESLVLHTATEAKRLGLRFTMQTCPGWAMSGGPWIMPEQAMRNLSYSRTDVEGGTLLTLKLPIKDGADWQDYKDLKVLAFPTPEGDTGKPLTSCEVLAANNQQKWQECLNGTLKGDFSLSPTTLDHPHVIEVKYTSPQVVRTLEFNPIDLFNHNFGVDPQIHVKVTALSETNQAVVLDADMPYANWQDSQVGMSFAMDECPDASRYRIEIANRHDMRIHYLRLFSAARKNNWEAEAGWTLRTLVHASEHPSQSANAFVKGCQVKDLTSMMSSDGTFTWNAPEGKWTILRIGHVNTGQRNGPAPAEATGWEVNKFDADYVDFQFNSYVGRLNKGPLKGLVDNMLMDSWECRTQTWTRKMPEEFKRVTGYDLDAWILALFGYVVDNHECTAEFLSDWRKTQNDLFVNNFFGRMSNNARKLGLTASFETAAGDIFPGDPMEYYKNADVPMCEFWQPFHHFLANHNYKPIRPTASAARMYAKPRVTAESFTSFALTWDEHLSMLREVANQNMVEGVSHFVFHTYTHNPDPDKYCPGTTFGGSIGTPFLRKQTWWKHMPVFNAYLARCTYMMERGLPVSSVLWFIGDEIQHKPSQLAPFPSGYTFDYCNTDALLNRISVKDGKWQTPEGICYDVLWIPSAERMLPETAERLLQLSLQGGVIVGNAPSCPSTLSDSRDEQKRFRVAVEQLWGGQAGHVLKDIDLEEALNLLQIQPDLVADSLRWAHRQTQGADWYYVCPDEEKSFHGLVNLNCNGRVELWDPVKAISVPIPFMQENGRTLLNLDLERGQCMFLVFRHDVDSSPVHEMAQISCTELSALWSLSFPEGWGIDKTLLLNELKAWKDIEALSPEGRAFSGTATYETSFTLPRKDKNAQYTLQLGSVEEIAVVRVNGKDMGTLWTVPYECDITEALVKGENKVEIEVTSTWYNRLAYDASLPENQRKTWVISGPAANSPLKEYGLLGPVRLSVVKQDGEK